MNENLWKPSVLLKTLLENFSEYIYPKQYDTKLLKYFNSGESFWVCFGNSTNICNGRNINSVINIWHGPKYVADG